MDPEESQGVTQTKLSERTNSYRIDDSLSNMFIPADFEWINQIYPRCDSVTSISLSYFSSLKCDA